MGFTKKLKEAFGIQGSGRVPKNVLLEKFGTTDYKRAIGIAQGRLKKRKEEESKRKKLEYNKERQQRIRLKAKSYEKEYSKNEYNRINERDELALLYKIPLKQFAGKNVRVYSMVNGKIVHSVELSVGTNINKWWEDAWRRFSVGDYANNNIQSAISEVLEQLTEDLQKVKVVIIPAKEVPAQKIEQWFAEGVSNCMLLPIREWALNCCENSKTKRAIERYERILQKIEIYEKQYPIGIPERDIQNICNDLQIGVSVELPFDTKLLEIVSQKKALKKFKYINTRLNHIDNMFNADTYEEVDINELQKIAYDTDEDKLLYKRDNYGRYVKIHTKNKIYKSVNEYTKIANQFEIDTGLINCYLDYLQYPELSEYIRSGCHFNEVIDFQDRDPYFYKKRTDIGHIDMFRAYTAFKKSKWYNGFLGKITDFRKVVNDIEFVKKNVGYYRINNLTIPDGKFKDVIDKLNCYKSNVVYPSAELVMLWSYGCRFDILDGCYGIKIDFEFPESMIDNYEMVDMGEYEKKKKIRYFSKWTGIAYMKELNKNYYMRNDWRLFELMRNYNPDLKIEAYDDKYNKLNKVDKWGDYEYKISYPKKKACHLNHIAGFITMYQRLNVIEQLMKMDIDKVIRVCVDGIYYNPHSFVMDSVFREKEEIKLGNSACESYMTNLDECKYLPKANIRGHYMRELFIGAGGNAKTHTNLTDKGFVNILYVAPSWKLSSAKKEYGHKCSVKARAIDNVADMNNALLYKRLYSIIVIDEASMITELEKETLFEIYDNCKVIFCGDLGFQLPPVINPEETRPKAKIEMTEEGFDNVIELTKNYRFTCEKHKKIIDTVRLLIKDGLYGTAEDYIIENYQKGGLENYDYKNDIILCSLREKFNKEYIGRFGETKWKILENGNIYHNGDIVFEKPLNVKCEPRHGYTVHSVQGETYDGKIYINTDRMFGGARMLYTAISRAKRWEQIVIIRENKKSILLWNND